MKKLLVLAFIAISFFGLMGSAEAMSEQQLKNKISQTYRINGAEFKVSNDNLVLLERYLNQYDISSSDADYIAERVDEVVAIIEKSGKTKVADFSATTKAELKAVVEKVSANTSVTATVIDGNVVVYKPDGTGVFAEVNKLVKQTGVENDMTTIVSISTGVLLVSALVLLKKSKLAKNA